MLIAENADISRCLIPEGHLFLPEVHIIFYQTAKLIILPKG